MKKLFFSVIAILMFFSFIGCDQLLGNLVKPPVEPPVEEEQELPDEKPTNTPSQDEEKDDIQNDDDEETPDGPEESIFEVAEKDCSVDVDEYDFSTGTWDYQLLTSTVLELDPEVGPVGTIKEEVVGYCYIFGTEDDSKVITVDTHGKVSLICASEEIYNIFKEEENFETLFLFGFSENAEFDDETLTISEIFVTDEFPYENETTYSCFINDFNPNKTNVDNTAYLSDVSDEYETIYEIYVKRSSDLPEIDDDENFGEEDDDIIGDDDFIDDDENNGEEGDENLEVDIFNAAKESCTVEIIEEEFILAPGFWNVKVEYSEKRAGTEEYQKVIFSQIILGSYETEKEITTKDTATFHFTEATLIVKCLSDEIYNDLVNNPSNLNQVGFENPYFDKENLTVSETFEYNTDISMELPYFGTTYKNENSTAFYSSNITDAENYQEAILVKR